jgi:SAM-dependent methyltransferase
MNGKAPPCLLKGSRKGKLLQAVDVSNMVGLEVGPLDSPIVSKSEGNVFYVDHASTQDLVAKYANDPNVGDVAKIVAVDFIWGAKSLRQTIPPHLSFDYVIASHVIEHVPDVIGWLREVSDVLKPEGMLCLAVPDRRYTFDYLRQPTTMADLLDGYLHGYRRPNPRQVFDYCYNTIKVDAGEAWKPGFDPSSGEHSHSEKSALALAMLSLKEERYIDVHCSVFTSDSFLELMKRLFPCELIDFKIASFFPPDPGTIEFFVILQKLPPIEDPAERLRLQMESLPEPARRLSAVSPPPEPVSAALGLPAGGALRPPRDRLRLSSETWRFLGLGALIFVLSAARMPATFLYPSFWAEDGHVFFRDSIQRGSSALVTPVLGMYLTLPRVIAWLASFLPVLWAPAAYAAAAGVLSSLSLALFSRDGFRWLIRSDWVRAGMCVAFSLVPGMVECFFPLVTLTYVLFIAVLFLLLERDSSGAWSMGGRRALLISFLWLSVGQGLVLAPVLLYLAIHTRNRRYLLCLASLAVSVSLNLPAGNAGAPATMPSLPTLFQVFADNLFVRVLYLPLLGIPRLEGVLALPEPAFLALSAVALVLAWYVFARFSRIDSAGVRLLVIGTASTMMVFPLTALTRHYGLGVLLRPNVIVGGMRYDVLPSILALLLASAILVRPRSPRARQVGGALLLALVANNVLAEPFIQPAQPFRPFVWEWPRQADRIERALAKRRAGRLRRSVVVKEIHCRPGRPTWGPLGKLTVAP